MEYTVDVLKGKGHIDAHQHFWKYNTPRDSWITDDMVVIRRDFLPEDLLPILQENGFEGCVTVQSDQSEEENFFQLQNADRNDFIKGVVGWVDFRATDIEDRLADLSQYKKLKGFRHILQGESKRDFMLESAFMNGISHLKKYNFTYDILVLPDQLPYVKQFVTQFPDQPFVINHLAKPDIKGQQLTAWKKDMEQISLYRNVSCKISGMVTEADWNCWKAEDFTPYMDTVVNAFGTDRIMFGSDWPVCLLAASYEKTIEIVKNYFSAFSDTEYNKFFGGNAKSFYHL
ncbi:MAG: amidohydrolase [Sphingobacteriales bacterium]|nr:amidohydrolase [Sphingobacteriales bacterium]